MSLTLPESPENDLDILSKALLPHMGIDNVAGRFATASASNQTLSVTMPHQIYFIELESIARGEMLSAAKLVGWRYLLLKDDALQAAAELSINEESGDLEFSNINESPFVEATLQAVTLAQSLEITRTYDFEVRLLKIPALHIVALWLQGESSNLIPLRGSRNISRFDAVYSEDEFFNSLKNLAIEAINRTSDEKGS